MSSSRSFFFDESLSPVLSELTKRPALPFLSLAFSFPFGLYKDYLRLFLFSILFL